jgi:glycosyltransferase involved in cell wall biosynthesis
VTAGSVLLIEEGGRGGVADYTAELAGALAGIGWRVTVATACDHLYPPRSGVEVRGVFPYVRPSRIGRVIRRLRLSKVVNGAAHLAATVVLLPRIVGSDLVHVQGGEWPPLSLVQVLLVRACGRPAVWTPHNTFERGAHEHATSRRLLCRFAGAVVLHAESDRHALPPRSAARSVVIPHGEYGSIGRRGPGTPSAAGPPSPPGEPGDRLVVLLFGQLRPDKGIVDLLQAAAEVPGLEVWLVGEDRGGIAAVGELLGDPRLRGRVVIRAGFLPAGEIPGLFAAADVVALPYRRASASGVLMLAYGYGRPVVIYPVGGLPEYVIAGETGWICDTAEPAALARALASIRDGGRQVCRERGEAARRLAGERFSWPAIATTTARLYDDLLGARSAYNPAARR